MSESAENRIPKSKLVKISLLLGTIALVLILGPLLILALFNQGDSLQSTLIGKMIWSLTFLDLKENTPPALSWLLWIIPLGGVIGILSLFYGVIAFISIRKLAMTSILLGVLSFVLFCMAPFVARGPMSSISIIANDMKRADEKYPNSVNDQALNDATKKNPNFLEDTFQSLGQSMNQMVLICYTAGLVGVVGSICGIVALCNWKVITLRNRVMAIIGIPLGIFEIVAFVWQASSILKLLPPHT